MAVTLEWTFQGWKSTESLRCFREILKIKFGSPLHDFRKDLTGITVVFVRICSLFWL